uniref:Pepsin inhibitor-3-like repeated domain-containing protein n=1 Tax=Parascaris univalens TaxID=6257 RepID=A0A915ADF9_PARUN
MNHPISTVLSFIFLVETINALAYYITTSSGICVVSDGVLYINGVRQRNLTQLENQVVHAYMNEYDNYTAQVEKCDNEKPRPENASTLLPIPPTTPTFCNNITVYYLKGCTI